MKYENAKRRCPERLESFEREASHTSCRAVRADPICEATTELRTPERLFNQSWALMVARSALERLGEEYARRGKRALFESLKGSLSGEGSEICDAALSEQLGKSQQAVRVERWRLKEELKLAYREYLRAEIDKTDPPPPLGPRGRRRRRSNPAAIDAEILELLAALE
jgi:hypothetical protein